jgi:hypothetical protein
MGSGNGLFDVDRRGLKFYILGDFVSELEANHNTFHGLGDAT